MRIIIITSSTNRSGGTRQAMYQTQGLRELGHEVTFCLPQRSELWDLPVDQSAWYGLPDTPSAWRQALEGLFPDKATPTIVHAFHNKAVKLVSWWGLFWRQNRRLACVAHRGVIYRPGNPLPYWSPAMRAFLVNSHACAKAMRWHCPARKIHVVNNGVPSERVTPTRTPEDVRTDCKLSPESLVFGYVGNNKPAKGMDILLESFAAARLPEARLLVLGTDPERWKPRCEALGIADQVCHIGRTEHVSDYLQICDVFVFPSKDMDSAPNTLLEAIRMGLPVVATTVGGVPEIVSDNGVLVPPDDVPSLRDALKYMAEHPQQRAAWAERSRTLGTAFTVEARCKALELIYESLC